MNLNPKTLIPDTRDTKTQTLQNWRQANNRYHKRQLWTL